jgi:hypothetical protein
MDAQAAQQDIWVLLGSLLSSNETTWQARQDFEDILQQLTHGSLFGGDAVDTAGADAFASRDIRPGRWGRLSFSLCKSIFYGAFVWARRALNGRKRRFSARAVARASALAEAPLVAGEPVLVLAPAGGRWLDATVVAVCDAADAGDAAAVAAAATKDGAAAGGHGSNGDLPQGVDQERQAADSSATAAVGGGGSEEAEEPRDAASAGSSQAEHAADSPPPPLPPDWAQSVSRSSGEVYYTHGPTGESQWEHPRSGASAVAPESTAAAAAALGEVRGICGDCNQPVYASQQRDKDEDGIYYHVNSEDCAAAADEPAAEEARGSPRSPQPRKRVAALQYAEPIGSAYRSQVRS